MSENVKWIVTKEMERSRYHEVLVVDEFQAYLMGRNSTEWIAHIVGDWGNKIINAHQKSGKKGSDVGTRSQRALRALKEELLMTRGMLLHTLRLIAPFLDVEELSTHISFCKCRPAILPCPY